MFSAERIPYGHTNAFTTIVLDYLSGAEKLRPFYSALPTLEGIEATILNKQKQPVNRDILVSVLQEQYKAVQPSVNVMKNIASLSKENTFTVCTAHQPNLFTGPLYFLYKIIHTIRLADHLNDKLPNHHFVPVYYMGSEDADFAELNHTWVDGKKIEWKKDQKGAVGRMTVDKSLVQLINELEGQLANETFGPEVIALLRKCYAEGKNIQSATFELVHELYGALGLVVLIPDEPHLKKLMTNVFHDDLFGNKPSEIVKQTSENLGQHFSVQAHPREINLFYLEKNTRERIIRKENIFSVNNTDLQFTEKEMQAELEAHPERFSPNVILRGLFQETILPNVVFIGGGGEMAYWLQLKELFAQYSIVYPVLILRNSFLVISKKWKEKIAGTRLSVRDFFHEENEIMNRVVSINSNKTVSLNGNLEKAEALYEQIKLQAAGIDPTLSQHVDAIKARSLHNLQELEKKMIRAEKRKFSDQHRQVNSIRESLFPNNGLQERVENFSLFYARWGKNFIEAVYMHSPTLEQQFTVISE